MMNFNIKQLEVFISVVDQVSFSRAGKLLGMAQASVSERIATLEKAVGVRLLNRMGRNVELTEAGERLITRAREIVSLRNDIAAEMMDFLGLEAGEIHVGGSTAPGEYLMPGHLGKFSQQYPNVKTVLTIADSERIMEMLEAGHLSLGVVGKKEPSEHLQFKRLWRDDLALVVHPNHPLAKSKTPVPPKDLANEKWVMREVGSATRLAAEKLMKRFLPGGVEQMSIAAELGSVTAVKQGVKANLGVALMSKITIEPDINAETLKTVDVKGLSGARIYYLVRDKRRDPSPSTELLWKFLSASAD